MTIQLVVWPIDAVLDLRDKIQYKKQQWDQIYDSLARIHPTWTRIYLWTQTWTMIVQAYLYQYFYHVNVLDSFIEHGKRVYEVFYVIQGQMYKLRVSANLDKSVMCMIDDCGQDVYEHIRPYLGYDLHCSKSYSYTPQSLGYSDLKVSYWADEQLKQTIVQQDQELLFV